MLVAVEIEDVFSVLTGAHDVGFHECELVSCLPINEHL